MNDLNGKIPENIDELEDSLREFLNKSRFEIYQKMTKHIRSGKSPCVLDLEKEYTDYVAALRTFRVLRQERRR